MHVKQDNIREELRIAPFSMCSVLCFLPPEEGMDPKFLDYELGIFP